MQAHYFVIKSSENLYFQILFKLVGIKILENIYNLNNKICKKCSDKSFSECFEFLYKIFKNR